MSRIGIGMIGGGTISNAHLAPLVKRDDARLVCIADVNEETARAQAERYGAQRWVTDYHELLAMPEVDAVIVGIPARFHTEAVIAAAERGKHILCEKPMARTLEECDRMAEAASRAGVVLQVAFVRRFDPDWGKLRELALAGRVGRPCLWRRMAAGSAPQPPYGAWYSDARYSDGPLTESASHDFDFVRYTFGEVKAVTASTWQMGTTGDVLDTGTVILDFESGDQMLCLWSWGLPARCSGFVAGLDVLGPEGAIQQPRPIEGDEWAVTIRKAGGVEETERFHFVRGEGNWFAAQIDNFIAAARGKEAPRATAEDGRKTLEIALAAFESSRTGRRIELPLR